MHDNFTDRDINAVISLLNKKGRRLTQHNLVKKCQFDDLVK